MKKIIIKKESDEKSFSEFKKDRWIGFEKVFLSKLWNLKKKKNSNLALDFRNLNEFEKPDFKNLKEVKYFFVNKKEKDFKIFSQKNKKIIYSFSDENFETELKNLLKKDKKIENKDWENFLKNIFIEISVEKNDEEEIFKKIFLVKKLILKFLEKKEASLIKISIKNNFSKEENQALLKNKILAIDGVVLD